MINCFGKTLYETKRHLRPNSDTAQIGFNQRLRSRAPWTDCNVIRTVTGVRLQPNLGQPHTPAWNLQL